jgi:succinoglycan biosynthesis transport protein ExoP
MNYYQNQPLPSPQGSAIVPSEGGYEPVAYQRGSPYPNYPIYDLSNENEGSLDFYKYLRIAAKYKWLVLSIVATSLLAAFVITYLMTPIFRATSSLQIDREAINILKVDGLQPDEAKGGLEFFQTQYELIGSRSLAERVVTNQGIAEDTNFLVRNRSVIQSLRELIAPKPEPDPQSVDQSQESKVRRASGYLLQIMSVTPVRGSRIVKINIDHPNPAIAQRLANAYAEVYIENNLDRRFDATSYARKFLEERLQQLKLKLEDSERLLVKYAEEKGIIQTGTDNKNLSSTDLEAINTTLAAVRNDRIKKELLWKQAVATSGLGLKEILESPTIQNNQKLRTEFAAQYQQNLAIYKPAFPVMVQLRNQIKELDRQIASEVEAIKQSIESSFLAAKEEEEQLLSQLENSKADVSDQRSKSIELNILQREVDTNRQLYDGLLQRYKEIGIAGGVGTNNISIVDKAVLPGAPRSPNMIINMVIGALAGVLIGFSLALLLDYLDDSFKSPEDIEREIGIPVIGVVPKPKAGIEVADEMLDARSAMSEAYRSLRTSLQFSTSDGLPRVLLVTSSKPAEGKTTTTISLAQSLAQIGLNVLLIDGDLRNASVHKRLRSSNELGLSNYLAGSHMPEDVVQSTETDRLVLISSGPLPPNPAELLSGPRMSSLLALARQSFDIVLIDGPPVMGLADAPLLSSFVNATMLVVAANETRKSTVKVALKRLVVARTNVIGALLNKFDSKEAGYGYGYGYGDYEYHSYGKTLQLPGQNG